MINILCGASLFAKNLLHRYELEMDYICDADNNKVGSLYCNIPVISYEQLFYMLQSEEVNVYLANRYTSATMKRLEEYLEKDNLHVYAFLDVELKTATEIKGMMDYYNKSLVIQKVIRAKSYIEEQDISEFNQEILIYTPGKVGTMSLKKSLENLYHQQIMFIHSMIEDDSVQNDNNEKVVANSWIDYSKRITKIVKHRVASGEKVKIISMVREPISRNMSIMFFHLTKYLNEWAQAGINITKKRDVYTEMFENIFYSLPQKKIFTGWFDDEIKRYLNIDVYEYPMHKDGYMIVKEDNVELLILKMEQLNQNGSIIGEFLGKSEFRLINDNMAEESWYDAIYREFKENFVPCKEYIDMMYQSKYMKHFYTQEEIKTFYKKYRKDC